MEGNCFNITTDELNRLSITRGVVSVAAFVGVVVCLAVQIYAMCKWHSNETGKYRQVKQRALLVLTIISLIFLGELVLQSEQIWNDGPNGFCLFLGYLDQAGSLAQLLLTIILAILILYNLYKNLTDKTDEIGFCENNKCWIEPIVYVSAVLVALFVSTIPFMVMPYRYDDLGPWCWITAVRTTDCTSDPAGIALQIILWYLPYTIETILTLIIFLVVLVKVLRFNQDEMKTVFHHGTSKRALFFLVVTFLLVMVVALVEFGTRILIHVVSEPYGYTVFNFYISSLAAPANGLLIPVAYTTFIAIEAYSIQQYTPNSG